MQVRNASQKCKSDLEHLRGSAAVEARFVREDAVYLPCLSAWIDGGMK
jgi:hypothetical protein